MIKTDRGLENSTNDESEQEKVRSFEIQKILLERTKTLKNNRYKPDDTTAKKNSLSKEAEQEKIFLEYINDELEDKITELLKDIHHLRYNHETKIKSKEGLEQKNSLLHEYAESLTEKIIYLEISKIKLNIKLKGLSSLRKPQQKEMLVEERGKKQVTKIQTISTKYYICLAIAAIFLIVMIVPYSLGIVTLTDQQYGISESGEIKSGYIIQNLKGDTIDTWLSWRIMDEDTLHVHIQNAEKYPEKVHLIKKAILSEDVYEISDSLTKKGNARYTSTYYPGWTGALNEASKTSTVFPVPKNLVVMDSTIGAGDIVIKLVDYQNTDGYVGFTKSIADESQNQILKSEITIYNVDSLTDEQFSTVLRHEMGHALGLAHSTASEDLMASKMITEFPYISECDVDAIIALYDGKKSSSVICEK